jgi:uncharacterized membrane protein HdeD (DUF308 family)
MPTGRVSEGSIADTWVSCRHAKRVIVRAAFIQSGRRQLTQAPGRIHYDRTPTQEDIMTDHTAGAPFGTPMEPGLRAAAREFTGYWWLQLVAGIAWIVVALVILQFDDASVTTVGILVGLMFAFAGIQNLGLASIADGGMRVVSFLFAGLFLVSAVVCFANPADTFAGLADTLGFLFLVVGIWWMVRAFIDRALNPLWWLGLISGILMTVMAFWTSGQFFIEKAYLLLVFAGIWALMEGTMDIVRAFEVRRLHKDL